MNNNLEKHSLNSIIPTKLEHKNFITFVEKYYEWMALKGNPSEVIKNSIQNRDVWNRSEDFLTYYYDEFGYNWIENSKGDRNNIITLLQDIYLTRGSIDSIKLLFRVIFGEEAAIVLPKELIVKPSSGKWDRVNAVMCLLENGDAHDLIDSHVTITNNSSPQQSFSVVVDDVIIRNELEQIYELHISDYIGGLIDEGSTISNDEGIELTVKPILSEVLSIHKSGSGFIAGDSYNIKHYLRNYCWNFINDIEDVVIKRKYISLLEKHFKENVFERYNNDIKENVRRKTILDGTTIDYITTNDYKKTVITRSENIITISGENNNFVKSIEVLNSEEVTKSPSIEVNWDEIVIQLIQHIEGIRSSEYPYNGILVSELTDGSLIGDINEDGVIDESDIEILVRRCMCKKIPQNQLEYIDEHIVNVAINANLELKDGGGGGANFRITKVSSGGSVYSGLLYTYGYNYPKICASFIQSKLESGSNAELLLYSNNSTNTKGYYSDRKGFASDINKIFDNNYYQDFSYVVESNVDSDVAKNALLRTVHPVGQKLFTTKVIANKFQYNGSYNIETNFPNYTDNISIITFVDSVDELLITDNVLLVNTTKALNESLAFSSTFNYHLERHVSNKIGITDTLTIDKNKDINNDINVNEKVNINKTKVLAGEVFSILNENINKSTNKGFSNIQNGSYWAKESNYMEDEYYVNWGSYAYEDSEYFQNQNDYTKGIEFGFLTFHERLEIIMS